MLRGRLINPITVTLRRLDTTGTRAVGGYDDTARETNLSSTSDGLGENMRQNLTDTDVPCQVEEKNFFEEMEMYQQGNSPKTLLFLTFHIRDLKRLGMWEESTAWGGRPDLKIGDQIVGFKDPYGRQLFKTPDNPGLFIIEVRPTGFLTSQNLVVCVVSDRAKGERGVERS